MRAINRVIVPCLLLLPSFAIPAATYEVAQQHPQANDEGPGTPERPWKSLGRAASAVRAGDLVVVHDGNYRESVVVKASGTHQQPITFAAAPGAHVVLTGADRLTGWRKSESGLPIYLVNWPHRFIGWSKNMAHPDDEYHRLVGRCEQVMIDGYPLRQVLSADRLAPGAFFADVTNRTLQVWDVGSRDLNKVHAEASVRSEVLRCEGGYVHLDGLRFIFAANPAQHGAVVLAGSHDRMEDCVIECMNASGATFSAPDLIVSRCTFRDNGQLGFGANGAHNLLFTECIVENNNLKGFDRGWEAGGDKLVLCRDAVLERTRFVRNRGAGIWFDIGNEHCTVRQCLIADNEDSGIFYEISFGLQAHDNVIVGNGFASTSGAWGAQAGISLSSSPECLIERNLIVGNREGFNFREQTRTTPRIGQPGEQAVWNHDQLIRANIIALNRDAQVWGWFDMKDDRHWPGGHSAPGAQAQTPDRPKPGDLAAAYYATNSQGQPVGLTLEKLHLSFEQNAYFAGAGQGWFGWGVTWGRHQRYPGFKEFQSALGIDVGGQSLDPGFAKFAAKDFRLDKAQLSALALAYPRGLIPGVILGPLD